MCASYATKKRFFLTGARPTINPDTISTFGTAKSDTTSKDDGLSQEGAAAPSTSKKLMSRSSQSDRVLTYLKASMSTETWPLAYCFLLSQCISGALHCRKFPAGWSCKGDAQGEHSHEKAVDWSAGKGDMPHCVKLKSTLHPEMIFVCLQFLFCFTRWLVQHAMKWMP